MNKSSPFIMQFFDDATQALEKWDKYIQGQFLDSEFHGTFYKDYYKGLGAKSSDERTLQFLIYIELCKKYKIIPEENSYKGQKRLDLVIYRNYDENEFHAEIGLELKWAGFTKSGRFNQYTLNRFENDFKKIKAAMNDYKYILQFGLSDVVIQESVLDEQICELDGRIFRSIKPRLIKINSFPTMTANYITNFVVILWSINN